jgi:hypothetical protein
MRDLGLERRTREIPALAEYLKAARNGGTEPTP